MFRKLNDSPLFARLRPVVGEFFSFAVIGAAATCVHYAILVSLVELAGLAVIPSTSIGFVGGSLLSYTLNRIHTFRHQPSFASGLLKYVATGFIGLGINALIVWSLGEAGLPYLLAQVVATGIVLVWNFFVARLVVFREARA